MPDVDEALTHLAQSTPDAFASNLREAVALAESSGARVWLLTQPYLDIPEFAGPTESSRRLEAGYRRGLAEHTDVVVSMAASLGTGLIALHETMPRQKGFFTDPIHMSALGNRAKAELIAEALSEALGALREGEAP
jgi:lysophospholipase L1-like esterase